MAVRNFSSNAAETTLAGAVTDASTSLVVAATTGFPAPPFTLAVDAGAASQELVLVTGVAGTTLTVTRGYDSTTASAHDTGAVVQHAHGAIDFTEANAHVNASSSVHGLTGSVVGTTDTQTLTGKTLDLTENTLTGTKAEFNSAVSDDDFLMASDQGETAVSRMVQQTFTITNPTINTVMSNATERTAMTTTYTKKSATTALTMSLHASFNNTSGVEQAIVWGLRVDGVDYDICRGVVHAAASSAYHSGVRRITGLAAGGYTIEPYVRSTGGIIIELDSSESSLSYSVREG